MPYPALVLAGGQLPQNLAQVAGTTAKALLPVSGKPMCGYVVEALKAAAGISGVHMVCSSPLPDDIQTQLDGLSPEGANIFDSLANGIQNLTTADRVLIVSCDLPRLRDYMVDGFLEACALRPAGLHYNFVARAASEAQFPGLPHTYVKLKEGTFCGGGLILLDPSLVARMRELFSKITQNRKNIIWLAALLGWSTIVKFLFRSLSIKDLEATAGKILGQGAAGICLDWPETAFNLDSLAQYQMALDRGWI